MLEFLFGFAQYFVVPEVVEVGQHTHDLWEAVNLADVEELKDFHLEAETGVYQQQNLNFIKITSIIVRRGEALRVTDECQFSWNWPPLQLDQSDILGEKIFILIML